MAKVEFAKSTIQRVTDYICPRRVVFHHVPKCGGTSVGRALRTAYLISQGTVTPEESFSAFAAHSGRVDREQMLIDVWPLREQMFLYLLFSDVRCVAAHVPFSEAAYRCFHEKYSFVTILRDPVDRFISNYSWSYGSQGHGRIDEPLEEFLATPRARLLGSTYASFFSGSRFDESTSVAKAVEASIRNLRKFALVGRLDDMGSFEAALRKLTRKSIRIGHENAAKGGTPHREMLSGKLRAWIADLCSADREIWAAVQDMQGEPAGVLQKPSGAVVTPPLRPATSVRTGNR